ncbi:MAG TPA: hypothetical protein VFX96_18055 [Pyrinomonadaceae bacterium]|nr:hypothetical protein [Pyrinomonadaceae bacterium]
MSEQDAKIEAHVRGLPDPEGARFFYERLVAEHPRAARLVAQDEGLLADALALAAWSPLLGTTLLQSPEYLPWLARERGTPAARVREVEELGESLARFALTHSTLDAQVLLARFRRRELLRIYLRDVRATSTIVETTEELSNLADAALQFALGRARQELENLYGAPQREDERGRMSAAEFTVVALGKLGSRELNYSSDIDLLFLYSDDGETTGKGERGQTTNREFFCRLAERVARAVGHQTGEGAAYRVDLRLRPHGRDGAPAVSVASALRYYREKAHRWELQALIRARASAGSSALFARFAEGVRESVYRRDETVERALSNVRLAKRKIDREHGPRGRGYNVKLGRGGIREIEFIAQALQLAYGGRDAWLQHAPHTLVSLGRLAERALLTERERTELSDAYSFLRTLEHRLQMEHGLQTHTVPDDSPRRTLVARRMHFEGAHALAEFDAALDAHTTRVRVAFERVFGDADADEDRDKDKHKDKGGGDATAVKDGDAATVVRGDAHAPSGSRASLLERDADRTGTAAAMSAATVFAARMLVEGEGASDAEAVAALLMREARASLNAQRALSLVTRVAASLEKSGASESLSEARLVELVRVCGASELIGGMLASDPALIASLAADAEVVRARDHRAQLRSAVDAERSFRAELAALRRAWARLIVEIGALDVAGRITSSESNQLQTSLAAASLNAALLVARRELARRHGRLASGPRLAVLGLGRLGSAGVDFGSDLDVVLVYDQRVPSPVAGMTREEAYARMSELVVTSLSNLTRDGHLYRVDLRLRPDGRNGAPAVGAESFTSYLRERAGVWEWLAYVKLRAVAGDLELGRAVEREARTVVHEAARDAGAEILRAETRRVRARLEQERGAVRGGRGARAARDIKFGPGGMLDVYFAARYLQLRDGVADEGEDRSTRATLARLRAARSLGEAEFRALDEGYTLLRALDHTMRLLAGRSTRLPTAEDHPTLRDLARAHGYTSPSALAADLDTHTRAVRAAYERITNEK